MFKDKSSHVKMAPPDTVEEAATTTTATTAAAASPPISDAAIVSTIQSTIDTEAKPGSSQDTLTAARADGNDGSNVTGVMEEGEEAFEREEEEEEDAFISNVKVDGTETADLEEGKSVPPEGYPTGKDISEDQLLRAYGLDRLPLFLPCVWVSMVVGPCKGMYWGLGY